MIMEKSAKKQSSIIIMRNEVKDYENRELENKSFRKDY